MIRYICAWIRLADEMLKERRFRGLCRAMRRLLILSLLLKILQRWMICNGTFQAIGVGFLWDFLCEPMYWLFIGSLFGIYFTKRSVRCAGEQFSINPGRESIFDWCLYVLVFFATAGRKRLTIRHLSEEEGRRNAMIACISLYTVVYISMMQHRDGSFFAWIGWDLGRVLYFLDRLCDMVGVTLSYYHLVSSCNLAKKLLPSANRSAGLKSPWWWLLASSFIPPLIYLLGCLVSAEFGARHFAAEFKPLIPPLSDWAVTAPLLFCTAYWVVFLCAVARLLRLSTGRGGSSDHDEGVSSMVEPPSCDPVGPDSGAPIASAGLLANGKLKNTPDSNEQTERVGATEEMQNASSAGGSQGDAPTHDNDHSQHLPSLGLNGAQATTSMSKPNSFHCTPSHASDESASAASMAEESATSPTLSQDCPQGRRQPHDNAIKAYRIWFATGKKQSEIATILTSELGRPVDQGTVSRWINRVRCWLEDGNVLPDLTEHSRKKPAPIDPARIDLGKRQDGRSNHQKGRHTSDSD